jgi:L-threonylcarbamoyladenylate synthase
MKIVKLIAKNHSKIIDEAINVLNDGGIIIYPTETCYGIGVDATNQEAVNTLLAYKTFRDDKPISVAVYNQKLAEKYVTLNKTAKNLYKDYLPGPFTIVSKGKQKVAQGVESDIGTLGIRIPNHTFLLALLKKFNKSITATSANASYKKTPYKIEDILSHTSKKQQELIDLIIDAGELPRNDPSTVIDTTLDDVNILRQGDIIIDHKQKIITSCENETRVFGEKLILNLEKKDLQKPVIIALQGELGTGKTQLCKGIAKQLGITQEVISPTYTICREYKAKKLFKKLYHIDTYKFMEPSEMYEIGWKDMLKPGHLIVIEWAEKISKLIKEEKGNAKIVWINMYHKDESKRIIEYGVYK